MWGAGLPDAGVEASPPQLGQPHGLGRRGRKPAWADSWQQQQLQQQQKLQLQQQQQQQQQGLQFGGLAQATEGVDDEDASSRASSPAKSPLFGGGQGSPFLDQQDQPLARHPQGARAGARLSQQGLGGGLGGLGSGRPTPLQVPGGFDAAAAAAAGGHQQTLQRPPSPLSRPGLPAWGASATEEGLPPVPRSPGLGGRAGTPTGRLFGGGAAGGLFGAAAPSDPMTYQMQAQLDGDGVPNMGDVQGLGGGAAPAPRMHMRQQSAAAAAAAAQQQQQQQQQWNIPALHTTPGSASRPRVGTPGAGGTMSAGGKRGLPDKKPGAAFKLGKRNAYLKYLAYEGCWQLCLDELLSGTDATATTFLAGGCGALKKALGVEQLFLTQFAADPSLYTQDGMQCIWDDREDVVLAGEVDLDGTPGGPSAEDMLAQQAYVKQQADMEAYQRELEREARREAREMRRLEREVRQQQQQLDAGAAPEPLARVSAASGGALTAGPALEVTVMRVVGCDLLTGARTGRDFTVITYAGSRPSPAGRAHTKIGSDGNSHDQQVVRLPGEGGQQQTFTAELHVDGHCAALGTVQVAELHKIASQGDTSLFDTPPPSGFLKTIFPCLRKGGSGHQGSMAWVKLVDDEGRVAGHAVLSARISMALLGGQGLMGPPSQRTAAPTQSEGTISINESDFPVPPPIPRSPLAMVPPGTSPMPPAGAAAFPLTPATGGKAPATATGGYLQVSSLQVYDELLESALRAVGAGPRNLALHGPWLWLLDRFCESYAVGRNYARLSYLKWVVRLENATLTADCFEVLLRDMVALQQAAAVDGLSSGELGVQAQVSGRIEELLHTAFENYFMLSEETTNGMMDGALAVRSGIPAVLHPAVHLYSLVRDATAPADQEWLQERFRVAARKRYQALLTAAELQRPSSPRRQADARQGAVDSPEAVAAYGRLEELCRAIMNELRADEQIRDARVLPGFVPLPDITALEYVNGIIKHLRKVLTRHPPPAPTEAAIRLVEAVGKLQNFVHRHKYAEANARLNNRDIFGRFVLEWIASSSAQLSLRCRRLEQGGAAGQHGWQEFASDGKNKVAGLVEDMLNAVQSEMGRYQRIITYWPMYGPDLERAVTGALREATMGVSRQCGLVQIKEGTASPDPQAVQPYRQRSNGEGGGAPRGGRTAWRWLTQAGGERAVAVPATYRGAPKVLQMGINPNQALLLNSLRRLLQVSPQMEQELKRWCAEPLADSMAAGLRSAAAGADRSTADGASAPGRLHREAPNLGAQFAQLVKELRSEYFAAITLCAERLGAELAKMGATSVVQLLRRDGVYATTQQLSSALMRIMEEVEKLLHWLSNVLDNRVFVALTRGLWDLTSKDVLDYTEDLREGGGGQRDAWRGRQSAATTLAHMDSFFKTVLTSSMGNDLQNKDLALPQHSDRAHKLLADNDTTVHMSYDVY
ncbi:plant MNA5-17 [Micractinium conductrix]|uniref:Plant MNA5-17 n=1 Tax=Micractinium conductrix TaxID=554055 RepID=A0A2P6VDM6_9CHLO|nr:plant MNA5-17 [Micractinium conductrix]|eukprot:PSC72196.1 plant MNA5-17 [Micractinium conductrix]